MNLLLADFDKRFGLDWTSVLVGWQGFSAFGRLVNPSDIREYALGQLETLPAPSVDLVGLAICSDSDTEQIGGHLIKLLSRETADRATAARKWVVCLLDRRLRDLPTDPLYGLLGLTEFWSDAGFPTNSPHQVQGLGNEIGPKDYYTAKNFREALDRHRRWIEKETAELMADRSAGNT